MPSKHSLLFRENPIVFHAARHDAVGVVQVYGGLLSFKRAGALYRQKRPTLGGIHVEALSPAELSIRWRISTVETRYGSKSG